MELKAWFVEVRAQLKGNASNPFNGIESFEKRISWAEVRYS